jgi:hypothetical protein
MLQVQRRLRRDSVLSGARSFYFVSYVNDCATAVDSERAKPDVAMKLARVSD